jgi:hypothetical protein
MARWFLTFLFFVSGIAAFFTSNVSPAGPVCFTLTVCTFAVLGVLDKIEAKIPETTTQSPARMTSIRPSSPDADPAPPPVPASALTLPEPRPAPRRAAPHQAIVLDDDAPEPGPPSRPVPKKPAGA